ncbi:hypothetical protein SDC9_204858 [bioreactor metagenome]|uniref:Uncharacterized protein n=1 Tax=bioreactor metagenome TaxID=1076179 RepID=A0A645J9K7_9ZZZZ
MQIMRYGRSMRHERHPAIRNVLGQLGVPVNHVVWGSAAVGYASKEGRQDGENKKTWFTAKSSAGTGKGRPTGVPFVQFYAVQSKVRTKISLFFKKSSTVSKPNRRSSSST